MASCEICNEKIDEKHDTYEITEVYIDGEFDDVYNVHTDCRTKQIVRLHSNG